MNRTSKLSQKVGMFFFCSSLLFFCSVLFYSFLLLFFLKQPVIHGAKNVKTPTVASGSLQETLPLANTKLWVVLPTQVHESCHKVPGLQSPVGLKASGMNGAEAASESLEKWSSFLRPPKSHHWWLFSRPLMWSCCTEFQSQRDGGVGLTLLQPEFLSWLHHFLAVWQGLAPLPPCAWVSSPIKWEQW